VTPVDEALAWLDARLGSTVVVEVRVIWGDSETPLLHAAGVLTAGDGAAVYTLDGDGVQIDLADVPAVAPLAFDEDELTLELTPGIWLYIFEQRAGEQRRPAGRIEV
jgi:hypothetical protein